MATFNPAIDFVLPREGRFVDRPNDPGGATNYGISLRFLRNLSEEKLRKYGFFKSPDLLTVEDIRELTEDQARSIYFGEFWEAENFEKILDQSLCNYLFDCAVLHGTLQAIKLAQRAVWAFYGVIHCVADDGVLGSETLHALNYLNTRVLGCLMAERAGLMRLIVEKNSKEEEFLNGWLKRCYAA